MERARRKYLHDALQSANEIVEFTSGVTFEEFASDRMRQKATFYSFAVLGEALNNLSKAVPDSATRLSGVRPAVDMRNQLIHGYSTVDVGIVWSTARQDIPNLRDEVEALMDVE